MSQYNREMDEPPAYADCTECGECYPHDVMVNNMCPTCHSDQVDLENHEFAIEQFNEAISEAIHNSTEMYGLITFVLGACEQVLTTCASDDDLWIITNLIRDRIKNFEKEGKQ